MTDEPREETQPEDEVEAHSPPTPLPPLEADRNDEGEDVEAHSPPTPLPESHRSDDEDVEAHSPPTPLPPLQEPPLL